MKTLQEKLTEEKSKISAAIASDLFQTSILIEDIEAKIFQHLRWGLFSDKEIDTLEGDKLIQIQNTLVEMTKIDVFSLKASKVISDKKMIISYDRQEAQAHVVCEKIERKAQRIYPDEIQSEFVLHLCLPDYTQIFDQFIKQNGSDNEDWIYAYVDEYEEMKEKLSIKKYMQIGGYGQFIQTEYDDSYIAQINAEIGDGGSVFVYCADKSVYAQVDMY